MPKTTTIDLYQSNVQAIRHLKETLALSSTSAVLAHLLDELAANLPATSITTSTEKMINQLVEVTTNQRLQLLRSATKSPRVADVVNWLLACYHERHAPPKHQPGEETFTAILAYLERQRKQKRAEKKAAKA